MEPSPLHPLRTPNLLRAAVLGVLAAVLIFASFASAASAQPHLFAASRENQCLSGRGVNLFLHTHHANVLRVVLSPYWATHDAGLYCMQHAHSAHYKVYLSLQFSNRWTPRRDAQYFAHVLAVYAPYLWAVGVGNEQDLPGMVARGQRHLALTASGYRAVWNAVEPVIARLAPHALRVYGDFTPWAFADVEEGFAHGRPRGVQVIAAHCYHTKTGGLAQIPALSAWAASERLPLWCSEMAPALRRRTMPHWALADSLGSWNRLVAWIVRRSPDLKMTSYYWSPGL